MNHMLVASFGVLFVSQVVAASPAGPPAKRPTEKIDAVRVVVLPSAMMKADNCSSKLSEKIRKQIAAGGDKIAVPSDVQFVQIVLTKEEEETAKETSAQRRARIESEVRCVPIEQTDRFSFSQDTLNDSKTSVRMEMIENTPYTLEECNQRRRESIDSKIARLEDPNYSQYRTTARIRYILKSGKAMERYWFGVNHGECKRVVDYPLDKAATVELKSDDLGSGLFVEVPMREVFNAMRIERYKLKPIEIQKTYKIPKKHEIHGEYLEMAPDVKSFFEESNVEKLQFE